MSIKDLTGKRFGRLIVLERHVNAQKTNREAKWMCKCDCGNNVTVAGYSLRSGRTKSCGCYQKERASESNTTHGQSKSKLYYVWNNMLQRCYNPKHIDYELYGQRGIQVCEDWHTFENFYSWALKAGYSSDRHNTCTIDRLDNNAGYAPNNCRLATGTQQARNRRNTLLVEYNGVVKPLKSWCEELKIPYITTWRRIKVLNWSVKDALEIKRYGRR